MLIKLSAVITAHIRNSHPEVFCNKGVLKHFAIFTGKHLCWSLFLINLQTRRPEPATSLKRNSNTGVFPVNIAKFLRTLFFTEHLGGCFLTNLYGYIGEMEKLVKKIGKNSFLVSKVG